MANFFPTDEAEGFYTQPVFSLANRARRLLWSLACLVLFRFSPPPLFGWRAWILRAFGARIGRNTFIYPSVKIWAPWLLQVDDLATLGPGVEVYNPGGARLEHHAVVSQGAFLCGGTHDFNDPQFPMTWQPVRVGAFAWIAARAVVLPGVIVGAGAVLGAAAVASRPLETWKVYAGNPARVVGERTRRDPGAA
jgi:putative colanic acid biosynthesis acetyltransferase WcaF